MFLRIHERYRIVFLSKDKYGPNLTINRVSKVVKCHKTIGKRWLARWNETKNRSDRPRQGRSRVTTAEDDQLIVDMVQQDVDEGITNNHSARTPTSRCEY